MTELEILTEKYPGHYINQKCLWLGDVRVEIDHTEYSLDSPLDYLKAFKRLDSIMSEKA